MLCAWLGGNIMCGCEHAAGARLFRFRRMLFKPLFCGAAVVLVVFFAWMFVSGGHFTSLETFSELSGLGWFWRSLKLTMATSLATTAIAMSVGVPAAYALSRMRFAGKGIAEVFFTSLLILPASSVGLMLMVAFQYEPVRAAQEYLHVRLVHSLPGVVVAQLVLALAFGVNAWRAAFDRVHPKYEAVARSLGGSPPRVFFTVTLPMAKKGIVAGAILAFTRAMAEFGAVLIMSSTFRFRDISHFSAAARFLGVEQADILAVAMWMEMEEGNIEKGMALAFIMLFSTALFVYAMQKVRE